jgi:hypothetical protein
MHDGSARRRSLLVCAPMRKPSLKRRKQPTPQEQAAAAAIGESGPAPVAVPVAEPKRKRQIGRALTKPLRLLAIPFVKLARLKGPPRIIVWGLILVIVVIGALKLRNGRDDDKLVREALARYEKASREKDYQTLCDKVLASSFVKSIADTDLPCEVRLRVANEGTTSPQIQVLAVDVNGDHALAHVRGGAAGQKPADAVYRLILEGGTWKIVVPAPKTPAAGAP